MKEFFRKILKNKKIILTVIFICIFSFGLFVQSVYAENSPQRPKNVPEGATYDPENDVWVSSQYTTSGMGGAAVTYYYDSQGNIINQGGGGILEGVAAGVITILAWILYGFAYVAGLLLTFIIWLFIEIIQYNDFINVPTVVTGWVIIRDLCNMFFVLILLVIAFATILRRENYSVKQLLPKLIIAAILINFSKIIFGLIIDFSQVIMLTFVNGFSKYGPGEFVRIFQINEYLAFSNTGASVEKIGTLGTFGALVAGFIAILITLVVMIVFVAVIIMRIILLWVYVILSPLVFLGRAFPGAHQYTERIFSDFIKQVIVGPMLAFFIWLALMTAQPSGDQLRAKWSDYNPFGKDAAFQDSLGLGKDQGKATGEVGEVGGTMNSLFQADNFQRYIIVIALLMGGLMVSQSMSSVAGKVGGKAMGAIQRGAWKYTGGRRVSERWGAFQGRREAERKAKAAVAGERMHDLYTGAKGVGAGARKAIWAATGRRVTRPIREVAGKLPIVGKGLGNTFRDWEARARARFDAAFKEEKPNEVNEKGEKPETGEEKFIHNKEIGAFLSEEIFGEGGVLEGKEGEIKSITYDTENKIWVARKADGEILKDAEGKAIDITKGVLTGKKGNLVEKHGRYEDKDGEYKWDEVEEKYYKVNKRGEAVDNKGEVITKPATQARVFAKGARNKDIKKMEKNWRMEMAKGWAAGRTKAWGMQNKAKHEKVGKQIDEMRAAGISSEMMRSILKDAGADKNKRLASALTLAIKEGFKGVDAKTAKAEVSTAKGLFGANRLLENQFDEAINKRFAHLNYDLSTEAGREDMKSAAEENLVDLTRQTAGAYGKEMVRVMKDFYGKQFIPKLDDTAKTSSEHRGNVVAALEETVQALGKPVDSEGKVDLNRIALANLTGDLFKAMAVEGKFIPENEVGFIEGLKNLIENAKIEHLAKIDVDLLDKSPEGVEKVMAKYGMEEEAENLIKTIRETIGKTISESQLKGLDRSRDATQTLKKRVKEARDEFGGKEKGGEKEDEDGGEDEDEDEDEGDETR